MRRGIWMRGRGLAVLVLCGLLGCSGETEKRKATPQPSSGSIESSVPVEEKAETPPDGVGSASPVPNDVSGGNSEASGQPGLGENPSLAGGPGEEEQPVQLEEGEGADSQDEVPTPGSPDAFVQTEETASESDSSGNENTASLDVESKSTEIENVAAVDNDGEPGGAGADDTPEEKPVRARSAPKGPDGVKEDRKTSKMLPDFPPKEEKKDVAESNSMKPLDPRDAPDRGNAKGSSGKPLGKSTGGEADGLQWIPSALAFQSPSGGAASAQSLRLEAGETSTITGMTIEGSPVFSVVNPPKFPLELEKGKSVTVQVTCDSVDAPTEGVLKVSVAGRTVDLRLYAKPGEE